MTNLPVREMVLYKHGVGFFVRGGTLTGESVSLAFRADEVNDVLKSLAVFDQAPEGQVLGVHYQTPMDSAHRLASTSINLSNDNSLKDLLRDLRGRHVVMNFETLPGRVDTIAGRVIGVNLPPYNNESGEYTVISILSTEGEVRVFPLETLQNFTIEDGQSAQDLRYFLDTAMSEDDRRVVNIRLNDADHDLVVSYVAPSPTWRVSYRVVAESDDGANTGKALLQGWGLFDNRLEEDLDNVQVTLVAGQPISFIYDLYTSKIPQRQTVQDEARVTGPVEFAAEAPPPSPSADYLMDADMDQQARGSSARAMASMASMSRLESVGASGAQLQMLRDRSSAARSTQAQAEGKETGETFQYFVTTPVSVKRGESALVPIIGAEVAYERELLYNHNKLPGHPVAALRFSNSTGLTLERGPVTLVENNDYKGEAIVPFTKTDNEVYLPYAVELGVRVKETADSRFEHHALDIKDGVLIQQQYRVITVDYTLENTTDADKTVTVERNIGTLDLVDTRDPDAETLNEKRWRVDVPAKSTETFAVSTRQLTRNNYNVRNLDFMQVQRWAEQRYLDQETFQALNELLRTIQFISKTRKQVKTIKGERGNIYEKQEQLRANLGALKQTGKEADLRDRVLKQLEETQDRLEEIDREVSAGERTITEAEKQMEQLILGLG